MSHGTAIASGALAVGTTTLVTGRGFLNSMQLVPDGTNAATLTVYDNTAGSGKVMAVLAVAALATLPISFDFARALRADIGITVVVAGGTAVAYVNTGAA